MSTANKDRLLTPTETAERIGLKPKTLAQWRSNKSHDNVLPWTKIAGKVGCKGGAVRYRESVVERYIELTTQGQQA